MIGKKMKSPLRYSYTEFDHQLCVFVMYFAWLFIQRKMRQ